MKDDLETDIKEVTKEFKNKSEYVKGLALGPMKKNYMH